LEAAILQLFYNSLRELTTAGFDRILCTHENRRSKFAKFETKSLMFECAMQSAEPFPKGIKGLVHDEAGLAAFAA